MFSKERTPPLFPLENVEFHGFHLFLYICGTVFTRFSHVFHTVFMVFARLCVLLLQWAAHPPPLLLPYRKYACSRLSFVFSFTLATCFTCLHMPFTHRSHHSHIYVVYLCFNGPRHATADLLYAVVQLCSCVTVRAWRSALPRDRRICDFPHCAPCFAAFMLENDQAWHVEDQSRLHVVSIGPTEPILLQICFHARIIEFQMD